MEESEDSFSHSSEGQTYSVDLDGVADVTTLAWPVDAAVRNAGAGSTQTATAYVDPGVRGQRASRYRNYPADCPSLPGWSAFQVEDGDQMADALFGSLRSSSITSDTVSTTTVEQQHHVDRCRLHTRLASRYASRSTVGRAAQDITFDAASSPLSMAPSSI